MARTSLTAEHQPEYDRIVQTIISLGLACAGWRGPELKVRRDKRRGPSGRGCPMRVTLYLRPDIWSLGDLHQTMAHELAHVLTHDEEEDHGPRFRQVLRQIVRAHWPNIEPWCEVHAPGAAPAYLEDAYITIEIDKLYERLMVKEAV